MAAALEVRTGEVTSADGMTIGWRASGTGPPAVLLHGTSGAKSNWAMSTPLLERELTLHAVDRRGRGASGPGKPYAFEREVEDLGAVCAALGEPPHVIGHSFGAMVALAGAAAGVPVRSLVLYEPPLLAAEFMDKPALVAECEAAIDRGAPEDCIAAFYLAVGMGSELEFLRQFPPAWDQMLRDAHTIPRELASDWSPDIAEDIDAPTLLLLGGENTDHPLFRPSIDRLSEAMPHAELRVLEGQGHLAHGLAPELYAEAVLDFVRRH